MKKVIKIVSIVLSVVLGVILIGYAALAIVFNKDMKEEYNNQVNRMDALYENPFDSVDESDFVNFDIHNNNLKLNEIQVLATHNSFKRMPFMPFSKTLELFWGQKVRNGYYGLDFLSEQFDMGIRGVELDVVMYGEDLRLIHDPVTDWRTNGPDFKMALEEIKLWSDINPGHIPINIMLQVRNNFSPFSHKFKKFTKQDIQDMDNLLGEVFGEGNIIKPKDIKGDHDTLREAVETDGWPELSECMGKVYFALLIGDETNKQYYKEIDPSFETQRAFIFSKPEEEEKEYTSFILADSPFTEGLEELIDKNYILRTRLDEQFNYSEQRRVASIELGSQILATDHMRGNLLHPDYVTKLTPDNKTVIKRGSVAFL
ncbi:MAG: Ca2+-dependent phosphoinositide-specific phospholipase C [Bacillota bacterium]